MAPLDVVATCEKHCPQPPVVVLITALKAPVATVPVYVNVPKTKKVPATVVLYDAIVTLELLATDDLVPATMFGTLIASMANLISYKILVRECGEFKIRYLAIFTGLNVILLAILLFVNFLI